MSRVYAAVSNKGGAGKTTLVTLAAGEYALRNERVLLIDADSRQNLSGWWRLCHNKQNVPENIEVKTASTSRSLETAIDRFAASFDLIVIDAPGVDSSFQTSIIRASELVISPIQPAIKEIEAAGQAVALVNEINDEAGSRIQHLNVKTRVTVPARNLEAYRYIRPFVAGLQDAAYRTSLLDTELFERNIYREIQNGLGTLQMQELTDSVRKARAEVQALVTEIESKRSIHLKGIAA
ncbi:chromosome partitioning protein [Rhizobium pisi]|uniref:Chromosome partitioning protein n=2 Tax=Rhizobium TaxID=379 RepID=A0A7W6FKU2_9HYPH|nr:MULTISPECIES: ParA family protein [Rhizobium]MBB3135990.1 chromosome partitioning protein [Rhizobium pisi]MBB3917224.1 chromosome partitioning protein [Rhizobium fabae]RSB75852.1 ParA family protein [Rhizobium pisi]RUM10298.1 ParA family protein [Rhizobium fabae]TCA55257.1 ParA family protein [Rhizobium pisi]